MNPIENLPKQFAGYGNLYGCALFPDIQTGERSANGPRTKKMMVHAVGIIG